MTQPLMRGYLQRLAQAHEQKQLEKEEEPADEPKPSKLANLLLEKWSWGTTSAPELQSLDEAAFADGLAHSQVESLARIGGKGKYPGNMHRDLVRVIGQRKLPLHGCHSNYGVPLKPKQNLTADVGLDFLLPHKLFSSLFNSRA